MFVTSYSATRSCTESKQTNEKKHEQKRLKTMINFCNAMTNIRITSASNKLVLYNSCGVTFKRGVYLWNRAKNIMFQTLIRRILQSSSNRLKSIWISCSLLYGKNQFWVLCKAHGEMPSESETEIGRVSWWVSKRLCVGVACANGSTLFKWRLI